MNTRRVHQYLMETGSRNSLVVFGLAVYTASRVRSFSGEIFGRGDFFPWS